MQRDLYELPLPPRADRRREQWHAREPAVALHLGLVLVNELERISSVTAGETMLAAASFHHIDELAAAAAIALDAVDGNRMVAGHQTGLDQRVQESNNGSRLASGTETKRAARIASGWALSSSGK